MKILTCCAVLILASATGASAASKTPMIFGLPFAMPEFRTLPPLEHCYDQTANRKAARACLVEIKAEAEAALKETVMQVRARMSELDKHTKRNQALRAFDQSQRQYAAWRDVNCKFYGAQSVAAAGEADLALDCIIRMTHARRRELAAFAGDAPVAPVAGESAPASNVVAEVPRASGLANADWRLREITDGTRMVPLPEGALVTLRLSDTGRVSGNGGVNRYVGAYQLTGSSGIAWPNEFALTRMAGPPELMALEAAYLQALGRASVVVLSGRTLQLKDSTGELSLMFENIGVEK